MRDQPTPEQTPERIANLIERSQFYANTMNVEILTRVPVAVTEEMRRYVQRKLREFAEEAQGQVDALTATLAHLTQQRDEIFTKWNEENDKRHDAEERAEQAEATLARVKAQRDGLRNALVKVRAHTGYVNPTEELLRGLLQSIERIADAALVDPPVSSSTETNT